jgi:Major Facilitator Superfamily
MFMLILWLQGIWLPEHGYSFSDTPLWAGIFMLPLSAGFLIAGPIAGRLADHFGARPFTTGGMILSATGMLLLVALPVDFPYWQFGLVIFLIGFAMGLFAAPNQTGIMNSLPPDQRGAGAAMAATFMNSATVLSIGIFFSLIIIGLSSKLPAALLHGLADNGVPHGLRRKGLAPAGGGHAVLGVLGLQPDGHDARPDTAPVATPHGGISNRTPVLPDAGLTPVSDRNPPGVLLRCRLLLRRRDRVVAAGRQVLPHRAGASSRTGSPRALPVAAG